MAYSKFSKLKFPGTTYASQDSDFFFVKLTGGIEIKECGTYQNDDPGTCTLYPLQIIEYTQYFNQIVTTKRSIFNYIDQQY
jgi:hypothetical protein